MERLAEGFQARCVFSERCTMVVYSRRGISVDSVSARKYLFEATKPRLSISQ